MCIFLNFPKVWHVTHVTPAQRSLGLLHDCPINRENLISRLLSLQLIIFHLFAFHEFLLYILSTVAQSLLSDASKTSKSTSRSSTQVSSFIYTIFVSIQTWSSLGNAMTLVAKSI